MRQYLNFALACFATLLLLAAWLVSAGCSSSRHAVAPRWNAAYDADWAKVCECWNFTPPTRPDTVERTDCLEKRGYRYFATSESPTGYATGIFWPAAYRVEFCDARALIHEFSHAVHYRKTGDPGQNNSGMCWL